MIFCATPALLVDLLFAAYIDMYVKLVFTQDSLLSQMLAVFLGEVVVEVVKIVLCRVRDERVPGAMGQVGDRDSAGRFVVELWLDRAK